MSFNQVVELKIQKRDHSGWTTMFHQDIHVDLKTANVIPFRNGLKKEIERIINEAWLLRHVNMESLKRNGTVLKFIYYHRSQVSGYQDEIVTHIKMSEEGWRTGIVMFAEKIWRS